MHVKTKLKFSSSGNSQIQIPLVVSLKTERDRALGEFFAAATPFIDRTSIAAKATRIPLSKRAIRPLRSVIARVQNDASWCSDRSLVDFGSSLTNLTKKK